MTTITTTTTTTTILVITVALAALVINVTGCPPEGHSISSCCSLGFNTTYFNRKKSGVYSISNFCGRECSEVQGYCDTKSAGGGWLVLQRRQDGSEDFNRNWVEYEDGFGSLTGEFWYGLRALHCLTSRGRWELQLEIQFPNGTRYYLFYDNFKVASAADEYKLTVSGFHGTTTDPMAYHNGANFTTYDRDNDEHFDNCALLRGPSAPAGGWWHRSCWRVNPNRFYTYSRNGVYVSVNEVIHYAPFFEMKIRPWNCFTHHY